jgi:hypothetical protein
MERTKLSLDSSKKALNIIHYKFNGNNDDYIHVFDTNVDSDCDDENVAVKSVCKDKTVKV